MGRVPATPRRVGAAAAASAAFVVCVAGLSGCAAASQGTGGDATPTPSVSVAAQTSSCADPTGDGGPADLTGVSIDVQSAGVEIVWTTSQNPQTLVESTDDMLWSVQLASADGDIARQLGVSAIGGSFSEPFVFDSTTAKQTVTGDLARTDATTVSATFPATAFADLGRGWRWSAATSFGGDDVDFCPDRTGSGLSQPSITAA